MSAHGKATGKGLHQATIQLVRAEHQAQWAERILPLLTPEELAVFQPGAQCPGALCARPTPAGRSMAPPPRWRRCWAGCICGEQQERINRAVLTQ